MKNVIINRDNLINKLTAMVMVVVMIMGLCAYYNERLAEVEAATSTFEQSISGFPESYKPYLRNLHKRYPNWKFVPYHTGLDFYSAVNNEYTDNKSLIENAFSVYLKSNATGDYNAGTGKYIAKDGGSWVSASKNCIAYFMDPRNFLDTDHIYMFELLSFDSTTQTQAGIEAILQGSFMYKTNIGYITTAGKYKTTKNLYSKRILEAAQRSKVSAYYIASKILQEIGTSKNAKYAGMGASGSISGTYSKAYTGIYNFYNIGASSSANPIANGLAWASSGSTYERPWTNPGKSIRGGAQYIGEKYINCGQNTTYYQRFNVNRNSKYALYTHQYMTNIYGAASEASYTAEAYNSLGIAPLAKTFVIPVYNNMPADSNSVVLGSNSTKKGKVISSVNVRKGASTEYDKVITLSQGDTVTVTKGVMTNADFGTRWLSNPYWYKISVVKNGKTYKGYVAASYVSLNKEYNVIKGSKIKLPITVDHAETVYYMSDNPAIATVDANGYITGKKSGYATIRVFTASGSMSASTVGVYENGCVVNPTSLTLDVGKKKKLSVTVYPSNATNKTVTYSSSNKAIAKVSSKGKITAKAPGTVTITAKAASGGVNGYCRVTVVQPVTAVSINKKSTSLTVGQKEKLVASVRPSNASNKTIKWKSSNSSVASVSASGQVLAVSAGTATITAYSHNNIAVQCTVKVVPKKVTLTAKSKSYNSVKLYWNKANNISGYWIYRKNSKGKYKIIATVDGKASSYKDKNLTTGHAYAYKVKAYRIVGKTKYKSSKSKAVVVTPIPAKPKITSAKVVKKTVSLSWKKVDGATGYKIYRQNNGTGEYKCIKTIKKQSTIRYSDKKVVSGCAYKYKIVAYRTVSKKQILSKYSKISTVKM